MSLGDNMEIIQLASELWVIKNFLTSSECEDAIQKAESFTNPWEGGDERVLYKKVSNTNKKGTLNEKAYNAYEKILKNNLQGLEYPQDETFIRFTTNGFMGIHYDNFQNEQSMQYSDNNPQLPRTKKITNQKYSCVVYLNDHKGGELYYPKWNVIYKPMKGDLVLHNAHTIESMHGSMPLKSSTRYIFTSTIYEPVMVYEAPSIIEGFQTYYSTIYPEDSKTINWNYEGLV
jgi:hypothetical protein